MMANEPFAHLKNTSHFYGFIANTLGAHLVFKFVTSPAHTPIRMHVIQTSQQKITKTRDSRPNERREELKKTRWR